MLLIRRWRHIALLHLQVPVYYVCTFELFHNFLLQEPPGVIGRVRRLLLLLFCTFILVHCSSGWRVSQCYNSVDFQGVVDCFWFCNCRWLLSSQLVSTIRVVRYSDCWMMHCIRRVFSHLRLAWLIDNWMQFRASSAAHLSLSWMNLKNFTGLWKLLLLLCFLWLFFNNLFANDRCLMQALLLLNHFRKWTRVNV